MSLFCGIGNSFGFPIPQKALRAGSHCGEDKKGEKKMYDVIIIGAGVTGSAVARELNR